MDPIFAEQTPAAVETARNSHFDTLSTALLSILSLLACACYIIYSTGRVFAQRYFFLPPQDFRETFEKAMEKPNGLLPKNKIGVKSSSYRRRLLMGSIRPSVYSTLPLNSLIGDTQEQVDNRDAKYYKLRVANIDKSSENRHHFLMNIKPIGARDNNRKKLFGFFHPFSYALGGGEKVLWEAVISTLENDINNIAIIYTFTPSTNSSVYSILENVKNTFGIDFLRSDREYLRDRIVFIHLPDKYSWLINGSSFPVPSMIGQAIGSIILVFLGFQQVTPDFFIDTIGLPFTYSLVYFLLDLPIITYIHYPTVSRDMLGAAKNIGGIYGLIKYAYWWILLKLYSLNIIFVNTALFNSTWTAENVSAALGWVPNISSSDSTDDDILYPPCVSYDDKRFDDVSVEDLVTREREKNIIYLAQFRPEKRHSLLIKHYKEYLNQLDTHKEAYKLVFIGAVREGKDEEFIQNLQLLIEELKIPQDLIVFELNAPTSKVEEWLQNSEFGINCMWKEHFGIAVVEYMLNGAIPLVHASAGPLEDIVIPRVDGHVLDKKERKENLKIEDDEKSGFFFRDETDPDSGLSKVVEYPTLLEMLKLATNLDLVTKRKMRKNAILVAREKFGRGTFSRRWNHYITDIINVEIDRRESRAKVEQVY